MVALEQEIASIIRFILDATTGLTPYYQQVPDSFTVPAVYFPQPIFAARGETFLTYALEYDWFVKFFASTDGEAQAHAARALNAICAARLLVPLIDEQGQPVGRGVRLKDPELSKADDNAYQIRLQWDSRRPYNAVEDQKMMHYDLNIYTDDAYLAAVSKITE